MNKKSVAWAILFLSTLVFVFGTYLAGVAACAKDCGWAQGWLSGGVITAGIAWFIVGVALKNDVW